MQARKRKVLVVDDSDVVLRWARLVLGESYDVITRTNPVGTGAVVIRERPDLVLVDVDMPLVEGDDVVTSIRKSQLGRATTIALFSAMDRVVLEARARSCGADGVVCKTTDPALLLAQIGSLIDSTRAETTNQPVSARHEPPGKRLVLVAGSKTLNPAQLRLLEYSGLALRTAATAADVLDELRKTQPGVVIVGQRLPDATAPALCETIRADSVLRKVSLLYVDNNGSSQQFPATAANVALTGSFAPNELLDAILKLVNVATRKNVRMLVRTQKLVGGTAYHHGVSHNLSVSGILLETPQAVELGEHLMVRFFVPGSGSEVTAPAEVVRHHARSGERQVVGLRFLDIRKPERIAIADFVERHEPALARAALA